MPQYKYYVTTQLFTKVHN